MAAVHEALPLRQCTKRLSARLLSPACVLAEMRRCGAPCQGGESVEAYAVHAQAFRDAVAGDPGRIVDALTQRIHTLAAAQRFEDAAAQRDRLSAFVRTVARLQRLQALTSVEQLVAAQPTADLGWEVVVVRRGRLAATGVVPRGAHPGPYVEALVATAETVVPGVGPLPAATAEETHLVLRWLETAGTRLVRLDGTWASPAFGAGAQRAWLEFESREAVRPFDDRRSLRPVARPARATA
jgi:DNA polymerase-3 subunit epsilon